MKSARRDLEARRAQPLGEIKNSCAGRHLPNAAQEQEKAEGKRGRKEEKDGTFKGWNLRIQRDLEA
ncbi:Protein of unknown function [Gryllus bimaculatus]|nr:Protein of unknown function [Gryllus bimaculatus]